MDVEVKQRNRRRKRAQRMQAQRDSNKADHHDGDSGDEDVVPAKPPRPPNRRKKSKEPLCEEEIIDGFAILQFRSYEDLELVLKISTKQNIKRLTEIERPKIEPKAHITNHILVQHNHALTLTQDPAASDDSGRASERLTGSSVAPRDADSSRDRLSDASSRCSSGKGYICDSEGEDDKDNADKDVGKEATEVKEKEGHQDTVDTPLNSPSDELHIQGSDDASSVIFASTPASRKREFPGALPPGLPSLAGGASGSPVPAPTPPDLPAPSPAPAQQPPHHPPQAIASAAAAVAVSPTAAAAAVAVKAIQDSLPPPAPPPTNMPSVPTASIPQPQPAAAAPVAHHHPPPALDPAHAMMPGGRAARTDSPAVATSANVPVAPSPGQYHHPSYAQHHQPLYAPYAAVTATAATTVAAVPPAHTAAATPYTTPVQAIAVTAVPPSPVNAATQLQPPHPPQTQQQQAAAVPATTVVSKLPTPSHIPSGEREKQLVPPSTRGPSPVREVRESYSNISSLSRSSASTTAPSLPAPAVTVAATTAVTPSSLSSGGSHGKHWGSSPATAQTSPAPQPRPTPPLHAGSFPGSTPIFGAPSMPPPAASRSSPMTGAPPNPNPFSAESLFQNSKYQTNQADMLRRELDNRFLASQDRSMGVAPPPYLRTEMHQHQHHHTHVHQHTTSLLPPPAASSLYPSPLSMSPMERLARRSQSSFKDIPKLGSVDSPFYRQNIGLPGTYPGYSPGLMHPGLTTGPTPFVPPNHLPTFQPKSVTPQDPTKPKIVKSGKWNAMHVRVAWEIYHHQQKSGEAKGGSIAAAAAAAAKPPTDLLRPPTHLFSPSVHAQRPPPHELQFGPSLAAAAAHRPPGYDQPPHHPGSLFAAPSSNLGKSPFSAGSTLSPFTRYGAAPLGVSGGSPFSMSPFTRDGHLNLGPLHHDPWRTLQRTIPTFPPTVNPLPPTLPGLTPPGPAPWSIKPDPILEQREREAREREERERERLRREREERERREREEKQRRLEQQQQEQRERERREREKREMERRELERQRERERERLLQEQRLAESAKQMQPPIIRDRSPMRNGDMSEIRVKEEPRVKEEDILARTDPRHHYPFLRHPGTLPPPPGPMLDRSRMLPHGLPPHPYHTAPAGHWGAPPTDPFYRYGYNPLMDAMRVQEERANFFSAYGAPHHPSQLRPKDPALMHLRTGPGPGPPPAAHKMSVTPPTDLHKKEEPR